MSNASNIRVNLFIKDIQEGEKYFCNPYASIAIFPEENKGLFDPYGEMSAKYNFDQSLICPITMKEGKITLLPDPAHVHTPFHKDQKKIMEQVVGWMELGLPSIEINKGDIESINIPYEGMELSDMEQYLSDWFTICEDQKQNITKIKDIEEIKNAFLAKVDSEQRKHILINVWNDLIVSIEEHEKEEEQELLNELKDAISKKLIQLGSSPKKRKVKALKDLSNAELEESLAVATQEENFDGEFGAIAIRDEINRRNKT